MPVAVQVRPNGTVGDWVTAQGPKQALIYHVAGVLDASVSMEDLEAVAGTVMDGQVKRLSDLSTRLDLETRATLYTFGAPSDLRCLYFDKDVLRVPSVKSDYHATGRSTALIDATLQAIRDLEQTAQMYGEHGFILIVITDGKENSSRATASTLKQKLNSLPSNWTVAIMVPDQLSVLEAEAFGFPRQNIAVWETSRGGMEDAGERLYEATERRITQAAKTGTTRVASGNGYFHFDTQSVATAVKSQLDELHPGQVRSFEYRPGDPQDIAGFVESKLGIPYVRGMAFYELVPRSNRGHRRVGEEIQPQKRIYLRDRKTGKYYTGASARSLLRLPSHTVEVVPPSPNDPYDIYVESTSVNRKLEVGQHVLVP